MAANDWHDGNRKALSYCVYTGSRFVLAIFNANHDDMSWKLPEISGNLSWNLLLDSSSIFGEEGKIGSAQTIRVPAWSVLLFEIKK